MAEIRRDKINSIAFYLPQYHAIPENDRAWGEGFTEWTNVRKATPLFEGHYQPRVPLNDNYYNLLNSEAQERQSALAQKYGVFGFCYYHYWFGNNKKLLEQPLESMLNNKNVRIPYCLCWANENWTKRWDGGNSEIIVEQDYGTEDGWKEHFEYLLPFFRDDRYITVDDKPLFLIYKPQEIPHLCAMVKLFRDEAKRNGFKDLCIMVQNPDYFFGLEYRLGKEFDYQIKFQPFFGQCDKPDDNAFRRIVVISSKIKRRMEKTLGHNITEKLCEVWRAILKIKNRPQLVKYSYDDTWKNIINGKNYPNTVEGAFVDWDNTPRCKKGKVYLGANPSSFGKNMKLLFEKIRKEKSLPIVFINAWNEWGEGAYLEPDKKYGYSYLEELQNALKDFTL